MSTKLTIRLHDSDPRSDTIMQWLEAHKRGKRNDAIVEALYAAATGGQQQGGTPAQPVQAAVDLGAIRQVVEAAVYTALNRSGQPPAKEAVQETIDDILADFDKSVIL
ncbi:MAG TPA: hypothetical protein ENJ02_05840 [Chloroflexi bacterium]|nr:hypothetical protein [Chloroflexota bacterium]